MNGCSRSSHLAVKVVVCLSLLGSVACGPQGPEGEPAGGEAGDGTIGQLASPLAEPALTVESNVDRAGLDYSSFDLAAADPDLCLSACAKDWQCQAYTYMKPGIQGPAARCWLKQGKPTPASNSCCVSGVKTSNVVLTPVVNQDRPGSDYVAFDLPSATPDICLAACAKDVNCKAYTYVNPGVQGPSARCWLKNGIPSATSNTSCTTGVKRTSLLTADLGSALGSPVRTGNTCDAYNDSTPSCAYSAAADNTFLWRAPYAGTFYINTLGSSYDTVLHVYDNSSGAPLNCNDDFDGTQLSGLVVSLAANQQIRIVVDGYATSCGSYHLGISCSGINCPAWTAWTSEEYPPIACNGNTLVNKARCRGSKCDDIEFYCEMNNGVRASGQYWNGYFSEEWPNYRICLSGYWITGISCTGSYCDNIAIQCTQMSNISWSASSCYWTPFFSEEYGGLQAFPAGYFAVGAKCSGSNCDNMSYYVCPAQ